MPGKILQIDDLESILRMGRVRFGSITREVCLAHVPDAQPGDYVLVHAGFAISRLDEAEARRTLEALDQLEEPAEPSPWTPAPAPGSEPDPHAAHSSSTEPTPSSEA